MAKKEQQLNAKFDQHFATVKQANGQPLNDKRNGQATLNKWERQNEGIRTMQKSIEATKQAIEIEEGKIKGVEHANTFIPTEILKLVESGDLIQWIYDSCDNPEKSINYFSYSKGLRFSDLKI